MTVLFSIAHNTVLSVSIFMMVACSATNQQVSTDGLATRSTINVVANISDARYVESGAYTRGEGAAAGVAVGVLGGMEATGLATDPYGFAIGIALIPVFATVGVVAGAASGTSKSRKNITQALQTINQAYDPSKYEAMAEREIAKHLNDGLPKNNACVTSRTSRNRCSQDRYSSDLNLAMSFDLLPSKIKGAGAGNVDFYSRVTVTTKPSGLTQPDCISFTYREYAGNIFDLAQNNGTALESKFSSVIYSFAAQFPNSLTAKRNRDLPNNKKEIDMGGYGGWPPPDDTDERKLQTMNRGAEWTRTSCSIAPRKSIKTDAVKSDPYKPRPPINMGGYGGWPPPA